MVHFNKTGNDEKILVTAALPYANGELHIGHPRSTYLPADAFVRYCRLSGKKVLFVCATDEHGTPIELKAEQQKISPQEFVKIWRTRHKEDFDKLGISFDVFYHTHSPENSELAAHFFKELDKKGLVYEKRVQQIFCAFDNRVLPDRYVKGTCPKCGGEEQYGDACEKCGAVYAPGELVNPKCAICGRRPTKKESTHFFFKLSAREEFCRDFLTKNKNLPSDVVNYLLNWVKAGLQDWDITRDGPYFGIPIPGVKDKYFYVWFDAPIGYVSSTKKYCDDNKLDWKEYWKPDSKGNSPKIYHFIGKDIQYFHFLFWPAMLDGVGFCLPYAIPTRGYLNIEAQKMSKSRGSFITLKEALSKFPADYYRYYLTAITPNNLSDGNFLWSEFASKVNSELIDKYGNFVYRTLSILKRNFAGKIPAAEKKAFTEEDKKFEVKLNSIAGVVGAEFEKANLKEGLEKTMEFAGECNAYFNAREPWKLLKTEEKQAGVVLLLATKAAFALTQLLSPIVPFSSQEALKQFNCALGEWGDYSQIKSGNSIGEPAILFKKIDVIDKG